MRLELDDVRKEYGTTTALSGVSLDVADGEFFTLVGPSGCGKTTTLRLVAGFESPSTGTVRFDGREMRGVPPEDRGVGVVFQNYALFPHMTVGENVAYGLRFSDPPDGLSRETRVAELLELVGLPETTDRDPDALSGGQKQRVALARALAPGPDLLLLDEPMSALDARLRERLRVQVKEIQSELEITTLYVTHDQEEALAISDRIAVMNDGGVEQVGPPRSVYREPETRFVAEFVGDNNVFEGRVDASPSPRETEGFADVDVGPATFRIATDRDVSPGDRLAVCVRPERLQVVEDVSAASPRETASASVDGEGDAASEGRDDAPAEDDAAPTNRLRARVTDAEFLGESTRVHLDWEGREVLLRTTDPLSGDVEVGFDPADAYVVSVR
jgi:thiamine transport system ATP-binding protein